MQIIDLGGRGPSAPGRQMNILSENVSQPGLFLASSSRFRRKMAVTSWTIAVSPKLLRSRLQELVSIRIRSFITPGREIMQLFFFFFFFSFRFTPNSFNEISPFICKWLKSFGFIDCISVLFFAYVHALIFEIYNYVYYACLV